MFISETSRCETRSKPNLDQINVDLCLPQRKTFATNFVHIDSKSLVLDRWHVPFPSKTGNLPKNWFRLIKKRIQLPSKGIIYT